MGRAKLNMELINKEKSRNITFKKRKEGLIRKMHEFTTLCDVGACMIIYGPKQDKAGPAEPEIWPHNADQVRRIIDIYKSKNKDSGNKTFGLSDFFHDRKRKIEEELNKLRKKNREAKYPTWPEFLNFTAEAAMRDFAAKLAGKADYVRRRIELMRSTKDGGLSNNAMDFAQARLMSHQSHGFFPPGGGGGGIREVEWGFMNHLNSGPIHYPSSAAAVIDHHHLQSMMLFSSDNELQFGGGSSTSGNISFKREVFCGGRMYAPSIGATPPHMVVQGVALPAFGIRENLDGGGQEDILQFQMNNHRGRYFD